MQSEYAHLNTHQSTAFEHRVHTPVNVEKVAIAAIGKLEHAQPLLEKHFSKKQVPQSNFAPKTVYNQTMYMPY